MPGNMPEIEVSIAFNAGYTTPAASRTWTDVTAYVESDPNIGVDRGRADNEAAVAPSSLSLTLDNKDGRFTPEYAAGAYYPNVKKGRPIRVRARWVVGSGTWYDLVVGYVDEWPVEWPGGSSTFAVARITATSRMARLGRGAAFKSIVEEEILYDLPILYFPLGEPEGALEAGNIAVGRSERLVVTQVGSGGTLEFGAGIGPGTDDLTAPILTPVNPSNGLVLALRASAPLTAAGDRYLEFECRIASSTTGVEQWLFSVGDPDSTQFAFHVGLLTNNRPFCTVRLAGSSSTANWGSAVVDGADHHIAGRVVLSAGASFTPSIMVDGGARVTAGAVTTSLTDFPTLLNANVGGSMSTISPVIYSGTLSHVVIASRVSAVADARYLDHYLAGTTGFAGEASGARVARYARLAGVPTAEISTETGLSTSIAHIGTTDKEPVGLMQDVAVTEDGLVFDGRDGVLTFHARGHRYGATSAFTLSCTAGEVEADLRPVLDDQGLTNDMTANRKDGATVRSVNQASIDENGYYRDTLEIFTTSDNEVQARADWQVNRFGTPRVKLTSVKVDVVASSSAQVTALLAADLGTRFTVSNLPAQAPASSMQFFVEGITYEIGAESFTVSFNTSAAAYADVWIWDTSVWDTSTTWAY